MSNPLESGTYRLYVWEVGGSSDTPTDTGRTGDMGELMDMAAELVSGQNGLELPDGRTLRPDQWAGYVVQPGPEESA